MAVAILAKRPPNERLFGRGKGKGNGASSPTFSLCRKGARAEQSGAYSSWKRSVGTT